MAHILRGAIAPDAEARKAAAAAALDAARAQGEAVIAAGQATTVFTSSAADTSIEQDVRHFFGARSETSPLVPANIGVWQVFTRTKNLGANDVADMAAATLGICYEIEFELLPFAGIATRQRSASLCGSTSAPV